MQFKPLTDKELEEKTSLPKGNFPATVLSAEPATSKKSGAEMIKVNLCVFVDSRKFHITDYLLGAMEVKLRHFCECAGLMEQYEAGTLSASDCDGKDVTVKLGVDKGKDGYPDKSAIKDYVPERKQVASQPVTPKGDSLATEKDDIPF